MPIPPGIWPVRRKPTQLKRLAGTLRRDRTNPREPRPPLGIPAVRRGTSAAIRREYGWLVRQLVLMPGVATHADASALELTAHALAEYRAAVAVVLEQGGTYESKTAAGAIMHRVRPQVAIAADAWRRAHAALQTFGLSPSSRPKIVCAEIAPPDSLTVYAEMRASEARSAEHEEDPMLTLARRRAERAAARERDGA